MQLLSNEVIYHDGKHNAFTSMVRWNDKYWVAFRNGASHKSDDGRLIVMNSSDLETWSEPQEVINTDIDDRIRLYSFAMIGYSLSVCPTNASCMRGKSSGASLV